TRNRVAGTGADDDEVIVLGLSHGNVDSWNLRVGGTGRVKQGANSHGRVSLPRQNCGEQPSVRPIVLQQGERGFSSLSIPSVPGSHPTRVGRGEEVTGGAATPR